MNSRVIGLRQGDLLETTTLKHCTAWHVLSVVYTTEKFRMMGQTRKPGMELSTCLPVDPLRPHHAQTNGNFIL
jgi:hypothetical protein